MTLVDRLICVVADVCDRFGEHADRFGARAYSAAEWLDDVHARRTGRNVAPTRRGPLGEIHEGVR